ncbi:MAG: aminodeoxychorismate lyase [Pseudohongiella sp.]|nr:MAG: aminodeoxychorismate lyase [Pseudohongiella sp.]
MPDSPLQSLINGQQAEHISIRDRGFQYGDGCFETIRVLSNEAILWDDHLKRLERACAMLRLSVDLSLLEREVSSLLDSNSNPDVILRITVTRGQGGRGYSPSKEGGCTRVLQLIPYSAPDTATGARAVLCKHRLASSSSLAGIKHLNRLDQVLASGEIPPDCDEGLCLDSEGYVIEGCKSNILLAMGDSLFTPNLATSGVEGVMLNHLMHELKNRGMAVERKCIDLDQLLTADEILLCNSVFGVWPLMEICNEGWNCVSQDKPLTSAALDIHAALFNGDSDE